jgi:dienelactone hydrolase
MKKFGKALAGAVVIAALLAYLGLSYTTRARNAAPSDEALAALVPDDVVQVESGDWLVMRPAGAEPAAGLIVYPGANCDVRGYAPVLRAIAAAGYLVVAVTMPFDFSIFAPNSADAVRAAYRGVRDWVMAGHSMGGAMAARYAFHHADELAGLILWDSYPPETNTLVDTDLPIVNIHRATPDGRPPRKFTAQRYLYPDSSEWVPIPGGNHMQFGSFVGGGYVEEWDAVISRDEQQAIVVAATLAGLARMTAR